MNMNHGKKNREKEERTSVVCSRIECWKKEKKWLVWNWMRRLIWFHPFGMSRESRESGNSQCLTVWTGGSQTTTAINCTISLPPQHKHTYYVHFILSLFLFLSYSP
jgi:hypothetical protein